MKSTNRPQLSVKSVSRTSYFTKENPMNRRMITAILTSLLLALFALSAAPAFAQDATPSDVDAAEQAYLQEYQQRAAEKYQVLKTTQAARNASIVAAAIPDWGGEMFVQEYQQQARDLYVAVQKPSTPAVVNSVPEWSGELFLAEYEQQGRERYPVWLAQQKGRLAGSTTR